MGVGRQDMIAPLFQHSLGPVLRSSAKSASERTAVDAILSIAARAERVPLTGDGQK
jgi:hypothetical protein